MSRKTISQMGNGQINTNLESLEDLQAHVLRFRQAAENLSEALLELAVSVTATDRRESNYL